MDRRSNREFQTAHYIDRLTSSAIFRRKIKKAHKFYFTDGQLFHCQNKFNISSDKVRHFFQNLLPAI